MGYLTIGSEEISEILFDEGVWEIFDYEGGSIGFISPRHLELDFDPFVFCR